MSGGLLWWWILSFCSSDCSTLFMGWFLIHVKSRWLLVCIWCFKNGLTETNYQILTFVAYDCLKARQSFCMDQITEATWIRNMTPEMQSNLLKIDQFWRCTIFACYFVHFRWFMYCLHEVFLCSETVHSFLESSLVSFFFFSVLLVCWWYWGLNSGN